jgi:hypothetical protein
MFRDTAPCTPVKYSRSFGVIYHRASSVCCLIQAGFLLGLLFDPEDGSDMFLRNVDRISPDYMTLYCISEYNTL